VVGWVKTAVGLPHSYNINYVMQILETERLILRHFLLDDLDSLFALYCDPDVSQYIPDAPRTYEETREELEWFMNGHPKHPELGLWATMHKEKGEFIGRCGLLPWTIDGKDEVEVAYLISKAYWRQGLGTEAAQAILDYGFEKLHLPRLICLVDEDNLASIKVAENIGMTFEKEGKDEMGSFLLYSINKSIVQKTK
jgi:RimJ/RimL family protein N-acetyltransferase